ncbi:hypothetical protein [Tenacibaculum sp.]|uniref:hypothetical protein n=1 Tax=Tenacibaculum sp. TaxID=1906242 RepID=UPI003D10C642
MSTLSKIVYNFKNLPGSHSDDFSPSDRQIEFIVNHFRSELASQRVNTKKSTDGFYQEIINLKVEKTKDFRPFKDNVEILRSKSKLPSMVTSHNRGEVIDFIGMRDDFLGFQKTTVHTFNIDLENPMVTELYFTSGDYLYIVSQGRSLIREVYMKAVFSDPREVKIFNGELTLINGMDWDYPLPDNLIGQLNNMIINNEFRWGQIVQPDLINDGKDA